MGSGWVEVGARSWSCKKVGGPEGSKKTKAEDRPYRAAEPIGRASVAARSVPCISKKRPRDDIGTSC